MSTADKPTFATLRRTIDLPEAVFLGLGSMIGTGVFAVIPLVAGARGWDALGVIAIAALLALANGLNSAQLAAAFPESGGTYTYGRKLLSPTWGFAAGWLFLLAKTASAASALLAVALYMLGENQSAWLRAAVALAILAAMGWVVIGGAYRVKWLNLLLVGSAASALIAFVLAGLIWGDVASSVLGDKPPPTLGFAEATAWVFVAFTGYGRLATLGEEIQNPQRAIPRAILLTLLIAGLVYAAVALVILLRPAFHAHTTLRAMALEMGSLPLACWVSLGAASAMLCVTLNLIMGLSRMVLAMSRHEDMPQTLAKLDAQNLPKRAVLAVLGLVALLILIGDLKLTWAFSAFTILLYYGVCHLAALRLKEPRYPRAVAWVGLAGCVFLASQISLGAALAGLGLIAISLLLRAYLRAL